MARVNHKTVKRLMNEKRSRITDSQFFTSRMLAGHFEDMAMAQTKRYNYNRRVHVMIDWQPKLPTLAYTDNRLIYINAGNPLVTKTSGRQNRYYVVSGLFAHELAHVLYTDFLCMQTYQNALMAGRWYPVKPDCVTVEDQIHEREIMEYLEDADNKKLVVMLAHQITNILEDGYIEHRFRNEFPGTLAYGIHTMRKKLWEQAPTVTETIEKEDEGGHIAQSILQILLSYATHGEIKYGETELADERVQAVFGLIDEIDQAVLIKSAKNRLMMVNTILVRLWEYLHDYLEESKKRAMELSDASGIVPASEVVERRLGGLVGATVPVSGAAGKPVDDDDEEEAISSAATAAGRARTHAAAKSAKPEEESDSDADGADGSEAKAGTLTAGNGDGPESGEDESVTSGTGAAEGDEPESDEDDGGTSEGGASEDEPEAGEDDYDLTGDDESEDEPEPEEDDYDLTGDDESEDEPKLEEDDYDLTGDGTLEDESEYDECGSGASADNGSENVSDEECDLSDTEEMPFDGGDTQSSKQGASENETGRLPLEQTSEVSNPTGGSLTQNEEYDYERQCNERAAEDIERILDQMAKKAACEELENERLRELNEVAQNISYGDIHKGINMRVNRISSVDDEMIRQYEQIAGPLEKIAKQMQKSLMRQLKESRRGGKMTGLMYGRRLDTHALCRNDGKVFYKNSLPNEAPELAVALLLDESGSMSSNDRCTYARATAIILHEFCRGLGIPVMIYGHSTGYMDDGNCVELYSYVEFEGIDLDDKYRLIDIDARCSNRDGAALRFVADQLSKRPEEIRLLILVSDGQPADYGYYGTAAEEDLRGIKQEYQRKNILFVAAAIGSDKENIERIYGTSFMDITDLSQMPARITGVVKRHIHV